MRLSLHSPRVKWPASDSSVSQAYASSDNSEVDVYFNSVRGSRLLPAEEPDGE